MPFTIWRLFVLRPIFGTLLMEVPLHSIFISLYQVVVDAVGDIERCSDLCLEPVFPEDLEKLVRKSRTCTSVLIIVSIFAHEMYYMYVFFLN